MFTILRGVAALATVVVVSGCLYSDTERAIAGAAGGALVASALDRNVVAGAALGAAGGALCDDVGICR